MAGDQDETEQLSRHLSVMTTEIVNELRAAEGGIFLDCTFGGGGHTAALLEANPMNVVHAFDRDADAVARGGSLVRQYEGRLNLSPAAFSELPSVLEGQRFNGIVADLGVSTDQLFSGRGFSFHDTTTLDMRMDTSQGITAEWLVNTLEERELANVLYRGGVGPDSRRVARSIVAGRPYSTAKELAGAVEKGVKHQRRKAVHPATVVFQALRMEVNEELTEIEALLEAVPELVVQGGRLAMLTFHSLEDKLVAATLRSWAQGDTRPARLKGADDAERRGVLGEYFGARPAEEEIEKNPSARSSRLRSFIFS